MNIHHAIAKQQALINATASGAESLEVRAEAHPCPIEREELNKTARLMRGTLPGLFTELHRLQDKLPRDKPVMREEGTFEFDLEPLTGEAAAVWGAIADDSILAKTAA